MQKSCIRVVCLVCPSICLSVFLSLIQCLCACHVTPGPATNWVSPSFSFLLSFKPSLTLLSLITSPSYLAAPMSKRSTVHCMERATVCRLYGGVVLRMHATFYLMCGGGTICKRWGGLSDLFSIWILSSLFFICHIRQDLSGVAGWFTALCTCHPLLLNVKLRFE